MRPNTDGILESSLYVSDVVRSTRFYQETFGFPVISEFGERGCAMHAGTRQVLLLFKKGCPPQKPSTLKRRAVPASIRDVDRPGCPSL
jgi:catechol 2,3-dioxygenase-like lactoylglutathione lyase family enzyme